MKRFLVPLLVVLFLLGFLVRLYRFDSPIADWHSFRQGDTNAVSQIYVRDGINLLYPRFFDISNLQTRTFDNPNGYFFVEFPILSAVQASLFNISPVLTLVEWGRLISIVSSLFAAFFVYLLTKKYASQTAGLFAAVFYLFLPFSIYYSRVILPEPSMVAAMLGGIYFFDKWLSNKKNQLSIINYKFFLALFLVALAFLLKPFALFFTLPIVYLAYKEFGFQMFKKWQLWFFAFAAVAPFIAWRVWIAQFPEGIPQSEWLFNGNHIRFRPAFFKWIFYERLTKLILGFAGVAFLIAGLVRLKSHKNLGFFLSFIVSGLIYVTIIATGNIQHDYYQVSIIPIVSMICGIGIAFLFDQYKNVFVRSAVCFLLFTSFYIAWQGIPGINGGIKDFYNINDHRMVEAGMKANEILPKDAKIIASHDGSTVMLNLSQRQGWPLFQTDLEGLIKKGATHIVLADPKDSDINGFARDHKTIASSSAYLILELTR